jgi:hypothetical protein
MRTLILAKEINQIGALNVYERNLRYANEDLLKEGNFSDVPPIEVLNTIKQEYNKKYRLDEDHFKELRLFGYFTRHIDINSKEIRGDNFYTLSIIDTLRHIEKFF